MNKNGAFLKSLHILNIAFIIGLGLFTILAYFLITTGAMDAEVLDLGAAKSYVYIIAGVFLFLGINVGRGFFISKMMGIPEKASFEEKVATYRTAFLVRAALVDLPAVFIVVFAMLLSNVYLLILPLFAIVILILRRPIYEAVVVDLKLNQEEQQLLLAD